MRTFLKKKPLTIYKQILIGCCVPCDQPRQHSPTTRSAKRAGDKR